MASHLRGGYPGAIYHVTCRMVGYAPSLRGYAGESQRDVAGLLNRGSGSSVCKQLAALPDKCSDDRRLRQQVKRVENRLGAAKSVQGQRHIDAQT